ncbi:ABC transporter substrate-binding protein [Pseudonocardia kunmingensis]|uniref:Amino acid/amide ABC transporter substrate-binding protein (HAAT family) n=1 Tax=Pseudonocardia kunmingensis TaxID=630975 RepID=A0A543DP49_9PSEU|nr:ABC transporter substrate-binding protein [Pseudonocardia kunmingensis]TQM11075.1 amino acid/amide ABC transporter substrate-binding protein (HAAT family) [Pseudonocardia kunmingensis]
MRHATTSDLRPPTRRRVSPLVAAAGLLLAAGCAAGGGGAAGEASGVAEETLTVGVTNALTGAAGAVCAPFSNGTQAWFEHVNGQGGVAGRQIEYTVLDDAYSASRAVGNVRQLQNEPVFAVVGGCGTVQAGAIYSGLDEAGIPYLFPYAGLRDLIEPVKRNVFAMMPMYEDQINALVPFAFSERGPGSVYAAVNQWPGYESAIANARDRATEGGGTFAGETVEEVGTTDYTPAALKVKAAGPDYVVVDMAGTDAVKFVDALVAQQAVPRKAVLGVSTLATKQFAGAYDTSVADRLLVASPLQLPAGEGSECAAALESAGVEAEPATIYGCAQGLLFTEAVEQTQPLTREGLVATLEGFDERTLDPALPPVSLSADDHLGLENVFVVRLDGREFSTAAQVPISAG